MVGVFCVCEEWSSKEFFQWEFYVDKNRRTASFIHLEQYFRYEDFLKIVSEDFRIQEEDINLSYEISLEVKSIVEYVPPISIENTHQLRTFIPKINGFDGWLMYKDLLFYIN